MTVDYFQAIAPLALVLALIVGAAWLLKRLHQPRSDSATLMKVQASLSLGPRERIVLVEVAGQCLVVGVTAGQINSLLSVPAQPLPEADKTSFDKASFAQSWLERYRQPSL